RSDLFAVSSLRATEGRGQKAEGSPEPSPPSAFCLLPSGLDQPLTWLTTALQAQDEARMERLWSSAGVPVAQLQRCVACFARRYPDAPAAAVYRQRLHERRRRQRRRRLVAVVATAACLLVGIGTYDVLGYQRAAAFETDNAGNPAAALDCWQSYQAWHPTRHL